MNSAQIQSSPSLPDQTAQLLPLRDIKLPAEPGFWPLAPGWWLLLVLFAVLLTWGGIKWYRHRLKKLRWVAINEQLSEIEFNYKQHQNQQRLLTDLSTFLRRFVKYQMKQNHASSLSGVDWITYLNQSDQSHSFAAYEVPLTQGVYQQHCDYDAEGLIQLTRDFIRKNVMNKHVPHQVTAETTEQTDV